MMYDGIDEVAYRRLHHDSYLFKIVERPKFFSGVLSYFRYKRLENNLLERHYCDMFMKTEYSPIFGDGLMYRLANAESVVGLELLLNTYLFDVNLNLAFINSHQLNARLRSRAFANSITYTRVRFKDVSPILMCFDKQSVSTAKSSILDVCIRMNISICFINAYQGNLYIKPYGLNGDLSYTTLPSLSCIDDIHQLFVEQTKYSEQLKLMEML